AAVPRQPQRVGRRHRRHLLGGPRRRRAHAPPRAGVAPAAGLDRRRAAAAVAARDRGRRRRLTPEGAPARRRRPPCRPAGAAGIGPSGPPGDAGLLEHVGGDAELAPGRVGDVLALAVGAGGLDELLLELLEVGARLARLERRLQVEPLLHQVKALQRVGGGDLGFDLFEPLLHRFGRALAASTRAVGLEGFQVTPDRSSLLPPLGKGRLVLLAHRTALACRWGHETEAYWRSSRVSFDV